MSGDFSRISYDPGLDCYGLLLQQGRVHLDSEWNELVAQFTRRFQAGTLDTIGRAVVPRETPEGFRVEAVGGKLAIGPGRIYVHGLLAENHGGAPSQWNPILAESTGSTAIDYDKQPYLPNAPALPAGGPHLVYLAVWQRELTPLQHRPLIEKAVGTDTSLRVQTVWQVRVLPNVGPDVDCATPLDQVPGWSYHPSSGRLTTATGSGSSPSDPCIVPESGGYKGLENQLYRIEIQDGGGIGQATFKWSRENASVATRVEAIPALDRLVVESVGRDDVLRFSDGDWVEITDDWRELNHLPGELRRIKTGGGVDDLQRTILLQSPLPAAMFPVDGQGKTDPARNTRLRRWDQQGVVRDSNGAAHVDLDTAGSTGAIPVPGAAKSLLLEHNILVTLELDPTSGVFHPGDYWVFAARTADASIEILTKAPPRGIHHHHTKLALVTFPDAETDCRTLWPPEEHEGCECTVCVSPEGHNGGKATLQHAVDKVKTTGGTICLGPGLYNLTEPVTVDGATSIRIKGQGPATQVVMTSPGSAIRIRECEAIRLESMGIMAPEDEDPFGGVIVVHQSADITVRECAITSLPTHSKTGGVGIRLGGAMIRCLIQRCEFAGGVGVASVETDKEYLVATALDIVDNVFECANRGVSLERPTLIAVDARIQRNLIQGGAQAGVVCRAAAAGDCAVHLVDNTLRIDGTGIIAATDGALITGNDIRSPDPRLGGDGIVLASSVDPAGIRHCQVIGNRIEGMAGDGIVIRAVVAVAQIKQNVIAHIGGAGITIGEGGQVAKLAVDNNQLVDVFRRDPEEQPLAGMRFTAVVRLDVLHNQIHGVGRNAIRSRLRTGIEAIAVPHLRIEGNAINELGPPGEFVGDSTAIHLVGSCYDAEVAGNEVHRSTIAEEKLGPGRWRALRWHASDKGLVIYSKAMAWVLANKSEFVISGPKVVAIKPADQASLAVVSNTLEASVTTVPAAEMAGESSTCIFTSNRCRVTTLGATVPVVLSRGLHLTVTSNRLRGVGDTDTVQAAGGVVAAVGNLITGPITVNGGPLPPAMQVLNPLTP